MRAIITVVIVATAGGGALLMGNLSAGDDDRKYKDDVTYVVQRGKLTVTVTENGSLMAKNSEKINFKGRRGGKISYLIEEGKTVEVDEVLCRLDPTDLETKIQELKLNIVQTEADLDTAKTELEIQKSDNVANIEKTKIALKKAENELEKYRDGDVHKERNNLEIAIKEAENKHSRAKKKYEDSKKLLEKDYVTQSQVDQDNIDFKRAEIQLTSAVRDLELFEKYTCPMTMTDKQAAVSDAARASENAQKRAQSKLRQREVAVESKEQRLKTLQKDLKEKEEELGHFTIKAPVPGIVIYGDPSEPWYRERVQLDNRVWGGFTLFTIPDLRIMQVQVQIHEADINKIKEEQVATVTMDTYPGLVLKGKVAKIAALAGEPGSRREQEVKKFTVDIILEGVEDMELKPGISAKADIFVEEKEDLLSVPLQSVFLEEGTHYCYKLNGEDQPERVVVKVGLSNDSHIEIIEGLAVDNQVLLYNPVLAAQAEQAAKGESAGVPATQNVSQP